MKVLTRNTVTYILTFAVVFGVLFALLIGAASIPQKNIQKNMTESAEYMCERQSTFLIRDFLHASVIDHYADCITLSIAYYLDKGNPAESVMWTSYYGAPSSRMNKFFLESVKTNAEPNQEYLRYWHGSAGVIRFLHQFWNIKQIYIFHAILMAGLYLLLMIMLIRNHMLPEALAFTLSMILVSVWYVPLCLEYTWMFLVMLFSANIATYLALRRRYAHVSLFFMIVGMVTAYFDFLTTETLTLLVPLLLVLRIRSKQGERRDWSTPLKGCISWAIGYVGMWATKWVMASAILQQNVMPYVTGHMAERLEGDVGRVISSFPLAAIVRNLKCLFPYEYGMSGAVLVFSFIIVVVILPVATNRVRLRDSINKSVIPVYVLLGLVPFVRYAVMRNHSYIHFFFTHRAMASTILALYFILVEIIEWNKSTRKGVIKNA